MTRALTDHLRLGAAVAAVVLAVLSRGDALVLAVALVVMAWRPVALAVVPALVAASWRWGSTSMEAVAGAQAVLGPAAVVGPTTAAAASWLAAAAVLGALARPGDHAELPVAPPRLLAAVATGATVAAVLAGAGPGGEVWARLVAGAVATVAALGLSRIQQGTHLDRALRAGTVAAGIGALVLVLLDAPAWSGTVDGSAVGEGLVIATAAVAVASVGALGAAMRVRRA